ncbi:MAG: AgmX/PglI C-terminal domain-containing protein [Myxococcales bacterium]|nr:AgmX/PglI C-terminal domain-containing protein [Myxococcales bacterium]
MYASVMLLSFLGHSGVIAYFSIMGPQPAEISSTSPFYKKIFESPPSVVVPTPPPPKTENSKEKSQKTKKQKKQAIQKRPKSTQRSSKGPKVRPKQTTEQRREAISQKLEGTGLLSNNDPWMKQALSQQSTEQFSKQLQRSTATAQQDHGKLLRTRGPGGVGTDISDKIKAGQGIHYPRLGTPSVVQTTKRKSLKIASNVQIQPIPSIPGPIKPGPIRRFIQRRKRLVVYCYEKNLRVNPDEKGRIVVRLHINTSGRINTTIEESDFQESLGKCIKRAFNRFRFRPPPEENTEVVVPFFLQRAN